MQKLKIETHGWWKEKAGLFRMPTFWEVVFGQESVILPESTVSVAVVNAGIFLPTISSFRIDVGTTQYPLG